LLNLIENEEDIGMTLGLTLGMKILLFSARSVFLIAVALYLYFLSRRKKQDVVVQMWACIIVGMLAGLAITLLPVVIGTATWASIQYSFLLYCCFFCLCDMESINFDKSKTPLEVEGRILFAAFFLQKY